MPESSSKSELDPIRVEKMVVRSGRLQMQVALSPGVPKVTDERLASLACMRFPSLPIHTCINGSGPTFASVIEDTSLPHLLEHLIIDAQVRSSVSTAQQRFVGTTAWIDEGAGRASIEVNFYDDMVALQAVKDALAALSDILCEYERA